MAELKEIEQAYQNLRQSFATTKKMPTDDDLQAFADLLPTDEKEQKDILNKIIKRNDRMLYRGFIDGLQNYVKSRKQKPENQEGDRDMADKEMDLAEALKVYNDAYGIAQADKPDAGATKQMYAALDIVLSNAEKDHETSKKAYEALMKAEEDKLKAAVESLEDGEFKEGALGALYAHKNRDKFRTSGIPEEEWANITSAEKYDAWMAAHPINPRENTPNPPAPLTNEQEDWVKEKAEWYTKYNKDTKHFDDFQITRQDTQFEVKLAGGTITYESKENVAISPGAAYTVYETLLREDHNKDRPVQFPANASEHLTSMLYAASILNETAEGKPHEMMGVDKTKIKMDLIEQHLRAAGYGDAEIKKVKDYYDAHEGKENDSDARGADLSLDGTKNLNAEDRNYTVERNGNDVVIKGVEIAGKDEDGKTIEKETFTFSYNTETKDYSYTDKKDSKEYTNAEDEGSQPLPTEDLNFLKDKADSFIKIQDDLQTQVNLAKKEATSALDDAEKKQQTDTRIALVEAFDKDPALFRRAMGGLIGNTTAESKEHEDLRAAQIDMLRARAKENGELKKHDADVKNRETARDRLLVLRGIKSNDDGKILGEDGKTPVKTDVALAKELSDNLKEFSAAKAKDENKNLTLEEFMTEKYKDKGLNKDEMSAKITTQATYNFQVEKYGKSQTTR